MNIVPVILIRKGKILDGEEGNLIAIDDLFKQIEKDTMIYVLDLDGIEHNAPSLDLYQKLTEHCILWIDDGPRCIDDVMDTIMAGATNITLREELWPEIDLPGVFEITDDEVYINIKSRFNQKSLKIPFYTKNIGFVVFSQESQINDDFISTGHLKDLALTHKIYLYNVNQNTVKFLEGWNITGLLIDLNKTVREQHGV